MSKEQLDRVLSPEALAGVEPADDAPGQIGETQGLSLLV
jgi:hypothetical protein